MRITKTPEERKAEMVAIASALFARQGFVRTSVSEITDGAKVAKGLFYYYFTTKDEMVKSVVEGYCAYLESEANRIASEAGTGREKLARLFSGDEWKKRFTSPMIEDLKLPQSMAVYCDMCDRMADHLLPAMEKMVAQMLDEAGRPTQMADQIAGTMLYGMLMMMRQNRLQPENIMSMMDIMAN
ncbi:MAG: TetR/AcrR family transcriptional regulator [Clostridia bacterium]|nr:TetR/AcrR family transcriptional regulator [Clostridia bacterium]